MLSNTATPYYYGQFREKVLRGEIPVNENVSLEMNRIDALIRDPEYYYDPDPVEGWIAFCENELTLTDGSDLYLLDTFKLWAEEIFGWYYFVERSVPDGNGHYRVKQVKTRLINKQYLIIGRGAAKTLYESCIHAYFLVVDRSTTMQVTTAPTMRQAEEVMSSIKTAIARARGPVIEFLTEGSLQNTTGNRNNRQKLASTKIGIQEFITNSRLEVVPMDIDKLQGSRCKIATIDEWLSGDIREDVMTPLEQSCAKNAAQGDGYWLIVSTSSEGTVRNGPGDDIKMELTKILHGEYYNPHVSIWWYKLDDLSEVGMPEMWKKANPNLGVTVLYDTYQQEVERAENVPSARNDILAKRFGIPMEGFTFFFTFDETKPQRLYNVKGLPCALGADLSQGDDFCSFAFLFPLPGGAFGIKTRNYISSKTLNDLPPSLRAKYEEFIREGSLIIMDGVILDLMQVYDELDGYITRMEFDIRCFGYDPYNAKEFVERWSSENGPFGIEKVIQGSRTESVPLGEIKKLASERLWIFNEGIMQFAMGNCIVIEDTNGNRKLAKQRYEAKIDPVAASMDAFVAYKNNQDTFE